MRYFSQYRTVAGAKVDTLSVQWPQDLLDAFSSIALLEKALNRMTDGHEVILIALFRLRRVWFPFLLELSPSKLKLPATKDVLSQGAIFHPDPKWLTFHAWLRKEITPE